MRRHSYFVFLAALLAAGCGDEGDDTRLMEPEDPHWGYSGAEGPEFWGDLSAEYALCSEGEYQSPVDFSNALMPAPLTHLNFDYAESPAEVADNGHTVVVSFGGAEAEPNVLMVDDTAYTLLQFHFHAPSEHRLAGMDHPLEMHFVHQSFAGALAVVGVFLEEGAENAALAEVFSSMSATLEEEPMPLTSPVDLASLLPQQEDGYRYAGSLTTPPCSEGVSWNVYEQPITLSAAQIEAFTARHPGSNRPPLENADVEQQLANDS